jgi:hypothetical protein
LSIPQESPRRLTAPRAALCAAVHAFTPSLGFASGGVLALQNNQGWPTGVRPLLHKVNSLSTSIFRSLPLPSPRGASLHPEHAPRRWLSHPIVQVVNLNVAGQALAVPSQPHNVMPGTAV